MGMLLAVVSTFIFISGHTQFTLCDQSGQSVPLISSPSASSSSSSTNSNRRGSFVFPSSNDFKPSRTISPEDYSLPTTYNLTGTYPARPENDGAGGMESSPQELQTDSTNHLLSSTREGRTFGSLGLGGWGGGGGSGIGNSYCQNLHSHNPGCCTLGYANCCPGGGSGGGYFRPRPVVGTGWGWGIKSPQHGYNPGYFRHPPPVRPVYPVVLPQPIISHHHKPHQGVGWNQHEKPGSCSIKSSFSFLNKFNIFNKAKDLFQKDEHKSKGWGWDPYPPSQSGGWYFHRRSDNYHNQQLPSTFPFKRQLDIPRSSSTSFTGGDGREKKSGGYYDNGNYFVIGGGGGRGDDFNFDDNKHHLHNSDNALLQRTKDTDYNRNSYYKGDNSKSSTFDYTNSNDNNDDKKGAYTEHFPTSGRSYNQGSYNNYYDGYNNVGIGSLTGRVLGGGYGWGSGDSNLPCRVDFDCPGDKKCCGGFCNPPSFFG